MKYISDKITANYTINSSATCLYYSVYANHYSASGNGDLIYTGRIVKISDVTSGTICLNDVIENDLGSVDFDETEELTRVSLIRKYTLVASGGTLLFQDGLYQRAYIYIQNMYVKYDKQGVDLLDNVDSYEFINLADFDGYSDNKGEGKVLALNNSTNQHIYFSFMTNGQNSTETEPIRIYYTDGTYTEIYSSWEYDLDAVLQYTSTAYQIKRFATAVKTIDHIRFYFGQNGLDNDDYFDAWYTPEHFGELSCKADYQVTWIGRNGAIYTRPFYGKSKVTETQERNEIVNMFDERHIYSVDNQVKLSLNSGWLKEGYAVDLMEQLAVSPRVKIYDLNNDKEYDVICTTDSYDKKTYKNEKGLINYSFDFELNKQENIKYK